VVYVLILMMLRAKTKHVYYGQIQEIWELDFHGFKFHYFRCNWVDAIKGAIKDMYGSLELILTVKDLSQSLSC
jgi:hypothetical protein